MTMENPSTENDTKSPDMRQEFWSAKASALQVGPLKGL